MKYKKIVTICLQILFGILLGILAIPFCLVYFGLYNMTHQIGFFPGSIIINIELFILAFLLLLGFIKTPIKIFAITFFITNLLMNIYICSSLIAPTIYLF